MEIVELTFQLWRFTYTSCSERMLRGCLRMVINVKSIIDVKFVIFTEYKYEGLIISKTINLLIHDFFFKLKGICDQKSLINAIRDQKSLVNGIRNQKSLVNGIRFQKSLINGIRYQKS